MKGVVGFLVAAAVMAAGAPGLYAAGLLKVAVINDSGVYPDDQVYVQMLGLDPAGSGTNGHVDLATSTWVPIAVGDNTVVPPGGPWPHATYTGYAKALTELTPAGLHTYTFNMPQIISGRVYISFGQPAWFHVNAGPALETPSAVDPSTPNYTLIFDKIELDYQPGNDPFMNTTTVDFFGISVMLDLVLADGTSQSRGFAKSRLAVFQELETLPDVWRNGLVMNGSTPVRFVAPNKLNNTTPFADYFDSYVTSCWNHYTTNTLTLQNVPGATPWQATGKVIGGVFTFTVAGTGETVTINNLVGQSAHIFGCDGPGYLFTTGSDSIGKQGIITTMGAALNRGVLYDGASGIPDTSTWWNNAALFYQTPPTNLYSKVLHEAAYQGYCYGFSYDDVGNFSTGVQGPAAEAIITIQAISDQPGSQLVKLVPNKTEFSTTDSINVQVDVSQPISTPFYPAFYLILPNGQRLYLMEGNRLTTAVSAFIERKQGRRKKMAPVAITLSGPVSDVQLFNASFRGIPAGNYVLQGGAVDARNPIVNGQLNWVATAEDTEILRVR